MDSWLLKTTVKRHENQNRKQRSTNKKALKNNRQIKCNNKKQKKKAIWNITLTLDHYPRNGQMGDTDPSSDM